ncbi:hypothetical protein TNCV_914971 [Trichonephila clavipes]|uniref:Uncharacterized protein n=1 Tax=Trichonephila clavipes TaxID=2585209 RepID=A0A8X6RDE6_TRICX|nr:hypothetical protein TNCV_914971 [Trichonephila clavipes]
MSDSHALLCMQLWYWDTVNGHRAASPLVWLVEGEERWEAPGYPQGFLLLNWAETEQNRTVTYNSSP